MSSQSTAVAPSTVYVPSSWPVVEIAYAAGSPPESLCTQSTGGWARLATTPETSVRTGSASVGAGSGVTSKRAHTALDCNLVRLAKPFANASTSSFGCWRVDVQSTGRFAALETGTTETPRTEPDVHVGTLRLSTPTRSRAVAARAASSSLRCCFTQATACRAPAP